MAREKDETRRLARRVEKPLQRLNGLFNDIMDNISSSDIQREKELQQLEDQVDDIISEEIQVLTKYTGEDISMFLTKLFNNQEDATSQNNVKGMDDIFDSDKNGIFGLFQERFKNKNLLYEDLNVVTSQLYELKEAISTNRDAIVTADDLSKGVSRTLSLKNSSRHESDKQAIIGAVENMEKKFTILQKLKEHVIPNTLQYGSYYVYTVPYAKLFEEQYKKKMKHDKITKTLEGVDEEFAKKFLNDNKPAIDGGVGHTDIKRAFSSVLETIEVDNENAMIPLLEDSDLSDAFADETFKKQVEKINKKVERLKGSTIVDVENKMSADGTRDVSEKKVDFSTIKECYIKLIDPRKMIPIKILDQTLGYYYIHQTEVELSKSPFTTTIRMNPTNSNPKELETQFLTKITDKIVKAFDKSWLEKNAKFKQLILNALIFNDVYKKQLKFQFIPVDYITEFYVNRNEDGEGTSIILPSLFYAKLYLSLLMFKIITIITKSNDTKIYYVKQSGIDTNVINKVQEVARSIKERQINFTDLLNYNSMVSKIGAAKDIFMPVGRSGEKGIDFDIMAGQDVQLNTELMEMLRTAMINATGTPSVIMNYVNEADYAKTLVMANAKFAGRTISHQLDFNASITDLYHKMMTYSTEIPEEEIESLEFTLAPPKALNTTNMTDIIGNASQTIEFMVKTAVGDNDTSDTAAALKDKIFKKAAKELLPMLPWSTLEEIIQEAKLEVTQDTINKKTDPAQADQGQ